MSHQKNKAWRSARGVDDGCFVRVVLAFAKDDVTAKSGEKLELFHEFHLTAIFLVVPNAPSSVSASCSRADASLVCSHDFPSVARARGLDTRCVAVRRYPRSRANACHRRPSSTQTLHHHHHHHRVLNPSSQSFGRRCDRARRRAPRGKRNHAHHRVKL